MPVEVVGVVVPAFNAAGYLAETLDSISAQTYPLWNCVIVDDGSSDDTARIADTFVARDDRFQVVRQDNAGVSAARNAGIAALRPDAVWLAFVDSDDTWLPTALEDLLSVAAERGDAVGVYGLAEYMDADGDPLRIGAHPQVQRDRRTMGRVDIVDLPAGSDTTFDSIVVSGTIWPPAVGLFRRAIVTRAGCFDPAQHFAEDWDLWVRMSRSGPFVPLNRQVAWYRQHDTNLTKHSVPMAYYDARVRWNIWRCEANTARQRHVAQRVWVRLQLRWVLWTVTATGRAVARGDLRLARETARACGVFTRTLLVGHPVEPDTVTSGYIARFIAPRRAGRGMRRTS